MTAVRPDRLSELLARARAGEPGAAEKLFPLLYEELRVLAGSFFRAQGSGGTLQPTALVHEAWLRLAGEAAPAVRDREHFLALAARAMRHVLVDHARAQRRQKRDADPLRITVATPRTGEGPDAIDLLALDEALERLAALDPTKAQLVEMRFFAGLSGEEAAAVLGVSASTADREWRFARAWLAHALGDAPPP
jgi:RNA polymerase sigma factor (TIGR02999 family)